MLQTRKPQFETVLHLAQIYHIPGNPDENKYITLYENLQKRFANAFGQDPSHFVRVPAVIDLFQSMTSSATITIEKDVIVAFAKGQDQVVVSSTSGVFYPQFKLPLDPSAKIQDELNNQKLNSLIRAVNLGYKAALGTNQPTLGFNCMISVTEVPQSMGFAFHSAVSIAIAMVTMHCNAIQLSKPALLQRLDQLKNSLYQIPLRREFAQLYNIQNYVAHKSTKFEDHVDNARWDDIYTQFLPNYHFVIADSLALTPKLYANRKRQAKRTFELLVANKLLRQRLNLSNTEGDILQLQSLLDYSDEDMLAFVRSHLATKFTVKQLEDEFKMKIDEFMGSVPYFEQIQTSNLLLDLQAQIVYHYKESIRVKQLHSILQSKLSEESKASIIGKLMDDSFEEYMTLLEEDEKEIKALRQILKSYNALGVKVIGTGGTLVALYPSSECESVVDRCRDGFYSDPKRQLLISDDITLYVFETRPSGCATYMDPKYEIWF